MRKPAYIPSVPREGELRILQLTDLHIGGSLPTVFSDRKAFRACYELIREALPDLIVITGDIAYPIPIETFTLNNKVPFQPAAAILWIWWIFPGRSSTEITIPRRMPDTMRTRFSRNTPPMPG